MYQITKEARELAVAWMECEDKDWIGQKHKLASDIMNYAIRYHLSFQSGQNDPQRTALMNKYGITESDIDVFMSQFPKGVTITTNPSFIDEDFVHFWRLARSTSGYPEFKRAVDRYINRCNNG
jgi:hypothetical protein